MSDLTSTRIYYETRELCHTDVYKHLATLRKSLSELRLVNKRSSIGSTLYWQQEVERIKLEKDKEWQEKIDLAEAENKQLRIVLQSLKKCDESKANCNLLMWEAENQIDQLSRELDRKLIHINQLQLALAEQTKAMFELEKSYVLLYWQYAKARQRGGTKFKKTEAISENGEANFNPSVKTV